MNQTEKLFQAMKIEKQMDGTVPPLNKKLVYKLTREISTSRVAHLFNMTAQQLRDYCLEQGVDLPYIGAKYINQYIPTEAEKKVIARLSEEGYDDHQIATQIGTSLNRVRWIRLYYLKINKKDSYPGGNKTLHVIAALQRYDAKEYNENTIAKEFGISRERVRQIKVRAREVGIQGV